MLAGVGCLFLGCVSSLAPTGLAYSLRWVLGLQLVGLSILTAVPWLLGRVRQGKRVHGALPVATQTSVSLALGAAFLSPSSVAVGLLASLLFAGLVVDGSIQLWLAARRGPISGHLGLLVSGAVTLGVAGWAALVDRARFWASIGPLIGLRLTVFGLALLWMARSARRHGHPSVYGSAPFRFGGARVLGEAYAVFIGNAFHLGVYVGDGQVVDFRNDEQVYLTGWDDFVLGRRPVRWEYPDLPRHPPEAVVQYARSQVGIPRPYGLFTYNCEHFVIECKSLGSTTRSRYAQMGLAESLFGAYPVLAAVVEVHTRFLGWLAYLLGGRFGRRLSLVTRFLGASMATALLQGRSRLGRRAR